MLHGVLTEVKMGSGLIFVPDKDSFLLQGEPMGDPCRTRGGNAAGGCLCKWGSIDYIIMIRPFTYFNFCFDCNHIVCELS